VRIRWLAGEFSAGNATVVAAIESPSRRCHRQVVDFRALWPASCRCRSRRPRSQPSG